MAEGGRCAEAPAAAGAAAGEGATVREEEWDPTPVSRTPAIAEQLAQVQQMAEEMDATWKRAEETLESMMDRRRRSSQEEAEDDGDDEIEALVGEKVDEAMAQTMARMEELVMRKMELMMVQAEERMLQRLEQMFAEKMAVDLLVQTQPEEGSTKAKAGDEEAAVRDRIETMVDNRLNSRLENGPVIERVFDNRLEDQQACHHPARNSSQSCEVEELPGAMGEHTEPLQILTLESRMCALEVALQKALTNMFPRVDALLGQLEARTAEVASVETDTFAPTSAFASPVPATPPSRSTDNTQALHRAAESGDVQRVRALLDAGADVHARDVFAATALHCAAENGHGATVDVLLHHGADAGCKNHSGWSALHAAARWGHPECFTRLLDAGADLEARDKWGRTPLHVAAQWGREGAARALLVAGASPSAPDAQGQSPVQLAASDAVRRLLQQFRPSLPVATTM